MGQGKSGSFSFNNMFFILFLAVFFIIILPMLGGFKKLLAFFGIVDNAADQTVEDAINAGPDSPFNANYWTNFNGGNKPMFWSVSQQICIDIDAAMSMYNDNEEKVIAAFKQCQTKAQVSFVCYTWKLWKGEDLITFLQGGWWPQDRLSNDELAIIINYVNKLPKS
jgi:hypothetical protein